MRLTAPLASSSLRRLHYEGRSLSLALAVDTTGSDPVSPIDRGTKLLVNFFNSSFMMSNHKDPKTAIEELEPRPSAASNSSSSPPLEASDSIRAPSKSDSATESPPTLLETAMMPTSFSAFSRPSTGVISLEDLNYQNLESLGEEESARDHA